MEANKNKTLKQGLLFLEKNALLLLNEQQAQKVGLSIGAFFNLGKLLHLNQKRIGWAYTPPAWFDSHCVYLFDFAPHGIPQFAANS